MKTVHQADLIVPVPTGGTLELVVNGERRRVIHGALSPTQQVLVTITTYLIEEGVHRGPPTNGTPYDHARSCA